MGLMKQVLIRLKDEQAKRLRALSRKIGSPVAVLIRQAVSDYLRRHKV
jgi:predicted DNA-binding protein